MRVISNSSPLISLAKIEQFFLLEKLFGSVSVTPEVYSEVVVSGAGLPGALEVSQASWLEVRRIKNPAGLSRAQKQFALDIGGLSTLVLAKEIDADLLLLDDLAARKIALRHGFRVPIRGSELLDLPRYESHR